jgi:molecular chaperone GrpE
VSGALCVGFVKGHFVPKTLLGNIIDDLTFALNLTKMHKKNIDKESKFNPDDNQESEGNIDINTDESLSGTSHLNEPVEEESESEKLKAELEDQKDKFIRKVAEFDNFKRRTAKEREEMRQTAGKEVITDLLDVLDDCDRAQKQIEKTQDKVMKDGVLLVFNKLRNLLFAKGLKPMQTIHEEFNPDLHEAITEIPAPADDLKGKILDEIVKGYYLNDKIIRHAKVVVGK